MNTRHGYTIFVPNDRQPWLVGHTEGDQVYTAETQAGGTAPPLPPGNGDKPATSSSADTEQLAQAIASQMQDLGYDGSPVLLALPSNRVMAAPVTIDDLPKRERRDAVFYRLEESIPLPAEDYAADFVENGRTALGVCADVRRLKPLIDALENVGVIVELICPTALVAAQGAASTPDAEKDSLQVWQEPYSCDLVQIHGGLPVRWYATRAATEPVGDALKSIRLECPEDGGIEVYRPQSATPIAQAFEGQAFETVQIESVQAAAARFAPSLLSGAAPPWINLRRDDLAADDPIRHIRPAMRRAMVGACVLLLGLAGAFQWRAHQHRQVSRQQSRVETAAFQDAFANQPVPTDVISRLSSEHKRLAGLSGESADLPKQASALRNLYEVMRRLPTDMRYQLEEIRLHGPKLYLVGQVRNYADADRLADSLRKQQGFSVESPRSSRVSEKSVGFAINAVWPIRQSQTPVSEP